MSSFLVLSEGDTRNKRDGQVCPDVGQGIMAPWTRRPGSKFGKQLPKVGMPVEDFWRSPGSTQGCRAFEEMDLCVEQI
ncbi:hypothetical protein TNCV_1512631 [Trichonephila clavipes]|nr:hypothetical protein TNCV_1512631 [Trichonephila clavipes]